MLDRGLDLKTWSSWKEQLSFGCVVEDYVFSSTLPVAYPQVRAEINDFLYFVVVHEFGHMFDFANELNRTEVCNEEGQPIRDCPMVQGSWGALSWKTTETVAAEDRFSYRPGLCFYGCNGEPMSATAVPEVYAGLDASSFISTYAATNPWDDLAESL